MSHSSQCRSWTSLLLLSCCCVVYSSLVCAACLNMAERPVCSLYFLGFLMGKVVVGHFQAGSQNCSESFHCASWPLMSCSSWYNRRYLEQKVAANFYAHKHCAELMQWISCCLKDIKYGMCLWSYSFCLVWKIFMRRQGQNSSAKGSLQRRWAGCSVSLSLWILAALEWSFSQLSSAACDLSISTELWYFLPLRGCR